MRENSSIWWALGSLDISKEKKIDGIKFVGGCMVVDARIEIEKEREIKKETKKIKVIG